MVAMKKSIRLLTNFIALCILLGTFLTGCGAPAPQKTGTFFALDTVIQITVYDRNISVNKKNKLLARCNEMLQSYEKLFSATVEGSDIDRINHGNASPVPVSEETYTLIETLLEVSYRTDGLIDPSIESVLGLWDFSGNRNELPEESALHSALAHVDYRKIHLSEGCVTLEDSQMKISLGCIAKGYIGEQLRSYLVSEGVRSALLNLGGNLIAIGRQTNGQPFRLGIQDPYGTSGETVQVLSVIDESLVTSGIYERGFTLDGIRYHHLLNPETGYPCESGLASATVLGPDSTICDALSTACFLMGEEKAMQFLTHFYPNYQVYFVSKQ